jgi:predicted ABC-type transport system involved in lysophospholipase L1 biosynthesis ATPase subunit
MDGGATHDSNLSSRCQRSIHLTDGHLVSDAD